MRGLSITNYGFITVPTVQNGAGIYISGNNNRIVGNYVGPLPDATTPDRKNTYGVEIIGNANSSAG